MAEGCRLPASLEIGHIRAWVGTTGSRYHIGARISSEMKLFAYDEHTGVTDTDHPRSDYRYFVETHKHTAKNESFKAVDNAQ